MSRNIINGFGTFKTNQEEEELCGQSLHEKKNTLIIIFYRNWFYQEWLSDRKVVSHRGMYDTEGMVNNNLYNPHYGVLCLFHNYPLLWLSLQQFRDLSGKTIGFLQIFNLLYPNSCWLHQIMFPQFDFISVVFVGYWYLYSSCCYLVAWKVFAGIIFVFF